jgi:AsmA protein
VQSLINAGYKQDSEAKTEFTELSVAVNIQNGVGQAHDIRLLGPFVRMSGKGSVDLAGQTIDMTLDPRVVGSLDGQGGDFDVSGLGMPIIVKGPLSGPSIYPDISGILADPNRALQALTQMGGGVGDLANKASGALGGLGQSIGDKSGGTTDGIVTGILGNLGNNGGTGANGAPAGNQEVVNSLLQGIFGQQQAQPATEIVETPASTGPAPTSPQNIPLPKSDPRGIVASAPPPEEEEPASPADQLVDAIVPPSAPEGKEGTNDLIKGLINQIGM